MPPGQSHVLCLVMHHIIADGWSLAVLTREFARLYAAFHQGLPSPLSPLPVQYADYAAWQRRVPAADSKQWQASLDFWQQHLNGAPGLLTLPTDHPRPALQSYRGAVLHFRLDAAQTVALQALARHHEVTLFMVLHAAWALLLGRLAGQDDVVVGVPVANRGRVELEDLIGFFVNTLALRLPLQGTQTVAELLRAVRAHLLAAQAHQEVPFEQVVEAVKPPRSQSHSPLFQVMFALQNTPSAAFDLPGLQLTPHEVARHSAHFDLTLIMQEADGAHSAASSNTPPICLSRPPWNAGWVISVCCWRPWSIRRGQTRRLPGLPLLDAGQWHALIEEA